MPLRLATIERIQKAAKELHYSPHAIARGLVSRRTHTLGIQCASVSDPHYARLLEEAGRYAHSRSYYTLLISAHGDMGARLLAESRIEGLIVIGQCWESEEDVRGKIHPETPLVYVGPTEYRPPMPFQPCSVEWNDYKGSQLVAKHLLSLGHTQAAMMAGIAPPSHPRVRGFLDATQEHISKIPILTCENESNPYEAGRQMLEELCLRYPGVTGVFCSNDLLAIGALSRAAELHIPVPEKLSIVGYSNIPVSCYTSPSLSSVATPILEAGLKALQMLISLIEEGRVASPQLFLTPKMLARGSSAPPERHCLH